MASKDTLRGGREHLEAFLAQQDLALLDEAPITFEPTESFKSYLCCQGCCACVFSFGGTACCLPIATFCPGTMYDQFSLQLDRTNVRLKVARNDCCCHVAVTQLATPLDKVQDVSLAEDWVQTLFGLKQVNVDSAGMGGAEVQAAFLAQPDKARDAIQLAVRLVKEQGGGGGGVAASAPGAMSMHRPVAQMGGSLKQRLDVLGRLVARGVLTQAEADGIKVDVLASRSNPLVHLVEAADLLDTQQLRPDEFAALKQKLLRQIKLDDGAE